MTSDLKPSLEQRRLLIKQVIEKLPISYETQEIIAAKSGGLTPAQLREVIFGLVISGKENQCGKFTFDENYVVKAINGIKNTKSQPIGFSNKDFR